MKAGLEFLGLTLNLHNITNEGAAKSLHNTMFSLFSLLFRSLRPVSVESDASPAAALLESADSRVGLDPHQAQELRDAAAAWLRVVR